MIRLFNVYYPTRMLVLVVGELLIVGSSFIVAAILRLEGHSLQVLQQGHGFYKILAVTLLALVCLDYFDLHNPQLTPSRTEPYFRLLVVLGVLSFLLAGLDVVFPDFMLGNNTAVVGLFIAALALVGWRSLYTWLIRLPYLRERVYVLGAGERTDRLVEALRTRPDLGMDVVGWTGALGNGALSRGALGSDLMDLMRKRRVDRVVVSLGDRRGTMPVGELLQLRLGGIKVEEATAILEKINGKIEVDGLYPSWFIFSEGFKFNSGFLFARRVVSLVVALFCLLVFLPLIPLIAIAVKLTSSGPVFYRQKRVGRGSKIFTCYKFRTMRDDAEAATGPAWADNDDPRITTVGRWLRRMRFDEVPQLWNVLRGDMGFVGPRPERPEFVEWLSHEIPYYQLRHIIRPGITGWAQIRYQYTGSREGSEEKLKYDLYYVKNVSLSLDLWVIIQTIKIVLTGRGSR